MKNYVSNSENIRVVLFVLYFVKDKEFKVNKFPRSLFTRVMFLQCCKGNKLLKSKLLIALGTVPSFILKKGLFSRGGEGHGSFGFSRTVGKGRC